jgi:hypothetical protein
MSKQAPKNSNKNPPANEAGHGDAWRADLSALLNELGTPRPQANRQFRDQLAEKLVEAANIAASKTFVGDINKVLGSVNQIIQPSAHYKDDRGLKKRALEILKAATVPPDGPDNKPKQRKVSDHVAYQERRFNNIILDAAERHRGDPLGYVGWLQRSLTSNSLLWTAANLTTATYGLCKRYSHIPPQDQQRPWERLGTPAAEVAALITHKAHEISQVEAFDQLSASNLTSTLPHVLTALTLGRETTRGLDQLYIESVARALQYCESALIPTFLAPMIFVPLGKVSSVHLSPGAQTALCELAKLTVDLTEKADPVPTLRSVAANFHALKGVTVWSNSLDNQRALCAALQGLNERFAAALSEIGGRVAPLRSANSQIVAEVSAGLSGVDFNYLTDDARKQSTRTIEMLGECLALMDHRATAESLGLLIHNLGTALDAHQEPLHGAVNALLEDVRIAANRTRISGLDEVGYLCAALVSLHPLRHSHWELIRALWSPIESVNHLTLSPTAKPENEIKIWASIHQAFALYPKRLSPPLLKMLGDIAPRAYDQARANKSDAEVRIAQVVRTIPGVKVLPPTIAYGFELDVLVELPQGQRLNIEADGLYHSEPGKRRLGLLVRDQFLPQKGIEVMRFDTEVHANEVIRRVNELLDAPSKGESQFPPK